MQVRFILLSHTWVGYRPVFSSPQMSRRWRLLSNKLSVGLLTCVRRSLYVSLNASVDLFTSVSWSLLFSWSLYIPRALSTTIEMMPATTANEIAVLLKHFSIAERVCQMLRPSMREHTNKNTHVMCVYTRVFKCVCKHERNISTRSVLLNLFGASLCFLWC